MQVKKSTLIWLMAMYTTISITLPYEWRIGVIGIITTSTRAVLCGILIYIICKIRSGLMVIFVLYNAILLFSTYYNGIDLTEQFTLSTTAIALVGAFELVNTYASRRQFKMYIFYFVALVVINSIQTIVYGGARDVNDAYVCIFGDKNWYLYKILPALFLLLIYCAKCNKTLYNLKIVLLWLLALSSVIVAQSGAGTLVLLLWGLYVFLIPCIKRIQQNNSFDNYFVYCLIVFVVFMMIVVWNSVEMFAPIIVGLLGKDLTFTTRTTIWGRAMELIPKKPILGYGALPGEEMVSLFFNIPFFTTTHNQYLGELFKGGILLLVCFLVMVYLAFKHIQYSNNIDVKKAMTFGIFCLLLWWMMESITSMYLVLVLFICYHLPDACDYTY